MTETKTLLAFRRKIKKKKPFFVSRDAHKRASVPLRWKRPRGRHSPVRQRHRGKIRLVSIGYSSPRAVKHLHPGGLQKVVVSHKEELASLQPEKQGVIISCRLGNKKRIEMIKLALDKKLVILNFKNPPEYLKELESQFQERKESQKKELTKKEQKESEKRKKAEEKEKKEQEEKKEAKEEKTPEEVRKEKGEETKEIEKTLIKKQ